jgi:hypothetical protein
MHGQDGGRKVPKAALSKVQADFQAAHHADLTQGSVRQWSGRIAKSRLTATSARTPQAGSGVVSIEARIDVSGKVAEATVIGSAGAPRWPRSSASMAFRPQGPRAGDDVGLFVRIC